MMQPWHIAVHVNASIEFIDGLAIMAFRERCEMQSATSNLLYIPPRFDRRKK